MMSVYLGFVVEQILKLSKTDHRKKSLYLADPGKKTSNYCKYNMAKIVFQQRQPLNKLTVL